jgi:hypothetical protein
MHLEFNATITAQDCLEAQKIHTGYRTPIIVGVSSFALGAISIIASGRGDKWPLWASIMGAWVLVMAIYCIILYPQSLKRRTAKLYSQRKDMQKSHTVKITDQSLTIGTEDRGMWSTPWNQYHKWKSNKTILLLYPSDTMFLMFPRSWFASGEEFQSFKTLLTEKIGPEGSPRK